MYDRDFILGPTSKCNLYRIHLAKRAVCYLAKNSQCWKRERKSIKIRGMKKIEKKIVDLTRGGNSNDITHCSLIQVNMVGMWWMIADAVNYTISKPRNWVRANRANTGLIRVGLGRARRQGIWAGSGRPSSKPGLARKSPK